MQSGQIHTGFRHQGGQAGDEVEGLEDDIGGAVANYGGDASERAMAMVRENAWVLYEAGKAKNSLEQFDIERPEGM